jgi:serine/threonine protein kinase
MTPASYTPEPMSSPNSATIMTGIGAPVPAPRPRPSAAPSSSSRAPSSMGSPSSVRGSVPLGKICPTCGERFPLDYRVCPRDVVQLDHLDEDDSDPLVGTLQADVYRVIALIGQGGMGKVYEARHARLSSRHFAIKVMHRELARKPELVTRFRREAELASAAAHPNVVAVFDVHETEEGTPFIVTELLHGEDLGHKLEREHKLPLAITIPIVRQLCAGLAIAHAQGVVHRDLKPDNVYLCKGEELRVKLLDFGIARVTDTNIANRTRTGVIMGTPAYMAPEQARGARVDARADIYSVGAILYRCLTGHEPFEADDPAATLTAVLTREPTRPRALAAEIPEEVELVIERAMARKLEQRFGTLGELDAALAELVGESPSLPVASVSHAAPAEPTGDTARAVQRARPAIVLYTGLAIVLGVGAVVSLAARLLANAAEAGALDGSEGPLLVLGTAAAVGTPAGLWIRWVARKVWGNSLRALALSRRMGAVLGAAAVAYVGVELASTTLALLLGDPEALIARLPTQALALAAATVVGGLAGRASRSGSSAQGQLPQSNSAISLTQV